MSRTALLPPRRFLAALLGRALLLLALGAAFNYAVDPYASFRWGDIKGLNDQKTLRRGGNRVNKALILAHTRFDVLFYGSSRGEMGLDPSSAALHGASAFNGSLSDTNIAELATAAQYAGRHQSPRLVVVGLDLKMFGRHTETHGDFAQSGFSGASPWPAYVRRLLSLEAFSDSGWVLWTSVRHIPQSFAKDGTYDISARKKHFDHRAEMNGVLRAELTPNGTDTNYAGFRYAPERMADLQRLLAAFGPGTRILLFVTPIHAKVMEAKAQAGLMPAWEQWKRDLTATVADYGGNVELWDFSGANAVTSEDIPHSPDQRMRWYWDGSHFSKAAGTLMLERMLGEGGDASFGTRLTPQTVEADIARIREERVRWEASHPDEAAEVRGVSPR